MDRLLLAVAAFSHERGKIPRIVRSGNAAPQRRRFSLRGASCELRGILNGGSFRSRTRGRAPILRSLLNATLRLTGESLFATDARLTNLRPSWLNIANTC
jgi:hypothetical protein